MGLGFVGFGVEGRRCNVGPLHEDFLSVSNAWILSLIERPRPGE